MSSVESIEAASSRARTANLLGALAAEVAGRIDRRRKGHANENNSLAAALNVIGWSDGCSNGELAEALSLSHAAAVRLVDKLETAGLAWRAPAADRRAVALRLTTAGEDRAKELTRQRGSVLDGLLDALTPEQMAQLDGIAAAMLRSMVVATRDAWFVCRLCDAVACPPDTCPVHATAAALAAA